MNAKPLPMCQPEQVGGLFICVNCGDRRTKLVRRACSRPSPDYVPPLPTVGVVLKANIADRYGVPACGRCHETAAKMDQLGPCRCREQLAELASELQSSAMRLEWWQLLEAAKHPRWSQVTGAVRAVAQGLEFYANLIIEACEVVEQAEAKQKAGVVHAD